MSTRLGPTELAEALGVSRNQIYKYFNAGKLTRGVDGKCDAEESAAALGRNLKIKQGGSPRTDAREAPVSGKSKADTETISAAQLRDLQAAADLKELKRDQLKGVLLDAAEVEKQWGGMVSATRSALLLLPAKLSPRVAVVSDVRECQALIEKEVRAVLSGLSEYQPNE